MIVARADKFVTGGKERKKMARKKFDDQANEDAKIVPRNSNIPAERDANRIAQTAYISNEMIREVKRKTTEVGQKLLYYIVSRLHKDDVDMPIMVFDVRELCVAVGWDPNVKSCRAQIKNIVTSLISVETSGFELRGNNGWSLPLPWLKYAMEKKGTNKIALQLNPVLGPFFLNLRGNFTQVDTALAYSLSGRHTLMIYELAKSAEYAKEYAITLTKLRDLLGLNEQTYTYSHLMNRAINPAVAEINKKTDLNISFEPLHRGRKIEGFIMRVDESGRHLSDASIAEWLDRLNAYRLTDAEVSADIADVQQIVDIEQGKIPGASKYVRPIGEEGENWASLPFSKTRSFPK